MKSTVTISFQIETPHSDSNTVEIDRAIVREEIQYHLAQYCANTSQHAEFWECASQINVMVN